LADEYLKEAQGLYDEFARFQTTRKRWRAVVDKNYTVDLGPEYASFPERQYDEEPGWQLGQYISALNNMSVAFNCKSRSGKAQAEAQDFEAFLNRLAFTYLLDREARQLVIAHIAGDGVGLARMDISHTWDGMPKLADFPDARKAKEAKEEFKLSTDPPFSLTWVDPMAAAWLEDNKGLALLVHIGERPVSDILDTYGDAAQFLKVGHTVAEGDSTFRKKAKIWEIATRDTVRHYVINPFKTGTKNSPELMGEYPNPFGPYGPYILFPGLMRRGTDPDVKYRPVIEQALELAPFISLVQTLRLLAARITGAPVYDIVYDDTGQPYLDSETAQPMTFYLDPLRSSPIPLPPGGRLLARSIQAGIDLDKAERALRDLQERYGPRPTLTGTPPEPRVPAYSYIQAGQVAIDQLSPIVQSLEAGFLQFGRGVAYSIKHHIKEPVLLSVIGKSKDGRELEPKIVQADPDKIGEYDLTVKVKVSKEPSKLALLQALQPYVASNPQAIAKIITDQQLAEEIAETTDDWTTTSRQIDKQAINQAVRQVVAGAVAKTNLKVLVAEGLVSPEEYAAATGQPPQAPSPTGARFQQGPGTEVPTQPEMPMGGRVEGAP